MKLYWRVKRNGKWTWKAAKVGGRIMSNHAVRGSRRWGYFVQEEE